MNESVSYFYLTAILLVASTFEFKEQKLIESPSLSKFTGLSCELECDSIQWASWTKITNFQLEGRLNVGKVLFSLDKKIGLQNPIFNSLQFSTTKYKPSYITQIPTPWMPGTNVPNTLTHRLYLDSIQKPEKLVFFVGSFPNENRYGSPQTGKLRIYDRNFTKLRLDSLCILFRDNAGVLSPTNLTFLADEIWFNAKAPGTSDGDILVFTKLPSASFIIELEHFNQTSASFDGIFVNVGSPTCCQNDTTLIDTVSCDSFEFLGRKLSNSGLYYASLIKGSCESITILNLVLNQTQVFKLPDDTSFCSQFNYNLSAPTGFINYEWSTGHKSQELSVNAFGTYWCCAKNACSQKVCDSITIKQESSFSVAVLKDTALNIGSSIQLFSKIQGGRPNTNYKYEWTPKTGLSCTDCPNPLFNPTATKKIRVRVTDTKTGCSGIASFKINVICCNK